jgi:putative ABC transport system permease protein
MSALRQIAAVTAMSVRGISQRIGPSCVIVIGITCVVGVLVSVLTMAGSFSSTLLAAGRADRAIVLRVGANSEFGSNLTADAVATVLNAPGIVRTQAGDAAASADMLVSFNRPRKSNGSLAPLSVRGVSSQTVGAVRPEIELVKGRLFTPGLLEVIVGRNAQTEFGGLEIGDRVSLRNSEWAIVGIFQSGDAAESGLYTDASTLQSAYQRPLFNSVTVVLESAGAFDGFKSSLTTNPALAVDVLREPEYFERQAENIANLLFFVTYIVSAIMAFGALFAALNTMYSAVSSRAVEIATLRALGFGAAGVVVSVLTEALLLALLGCFVGAAVSSAIFSGDTISLGGGQSALITELRVTPSIVGAAIAWACTVGLLGALLPAIRAARLPVATALRAI